MPRFYLHLRNDRTVEDQEGLILEDAEAARHEAIRSARDILAAEIRQGRLHLGGQIEVADENNRPILTVPFRQAIVIEG